MENLVFTEQLTCMTFGCLLMWQALQVYFDLTVWTTPRWFPWNFAAIHWFACPNCCLDLWSCILCLVREFSGLPNTVMLSESSYIILRVHHVLYLQDRGNLLPVHIQSFLLWQLPRSLSPKTSLRTCRKPLARGYGSDVCNGVYIPNSTAMKLGRAILGAAVKVEILSMPAANLVKPKLLE